jgi:hypothetical protein
MFWRVNRLFSGSEAIETVWFTISRACGIFGLFALAKVLGAAALNGFSFYK